MQHTFINLIDKITQIKRNSNLNRNLVFLLSLAFATFLISACNQTSSALKTWKLAPTGIFSADLSSHYALIGSINGKAELWQLQEKTLTHSWQHNSDTEGGVIAVAISDDENFAVTAERNSMVWWQVSSGKLKGSWLLPNIKCLTLSADGHYALIGLADKAIYFSLRHGQTVFAFPHNGAVNTVALSQNGEFAMTGSDDQSARLWRLNNGELVHSWQHKTKIATVALSSNGKYAITNPALGQTKVWSTATGKFMKNIGPSLLTISAADFSENQDFLATGRTSQRIDMWKLKTGKDIQQWKPKKENIWRPSASTVLALKFVNDGKKLLSASSNGYVQMWKIE